MVLPSRGMWHFLPRPWLADLALCVLELALKEEGLSSMVGA